MLIVTTLKDRLLGAILGFQIGRRSIELCALTGLTRKDIFFLYGQKRLERRLKKHDVISILYMDAQLFKAINDKLSHAVGDIFLKVAGEIILALFREKDSETYRFGGDEKCIFMSGVPFETAVQRAHLLRSYFLICIYSNHFRGTVLETLRLEGKEDRFPFLKEILNGVDLNIGVASGAADADLNAIIGQAEAAMEQVKAANKQRLALKWLLR